MKLIAIRLGDLRYGEEFLTSLTHQHGTVITTGHILWEDRTNHRTRVRAVKVRYSTCERIHVAETKVLVEADRPHARFTEAEAKRRWSELLRDPDNVATVGEVVKSKGAA